LLVKLYKTHDCSLATRKNCILTPYITIAECYNYTLGILRHAGSTHEIYTA